VQLLFYNAFRSAIVGEREALKTYGISVQEAEVQTKAFSMTGKRSADELTKQEKALATTELIFERAAVQIGNAEREAGGFAAQMLLSRSATQQLREEVGEQLLPASGELLQVFNNFVSDVSPAVVSGFGLINDAIVATVDATQRGNKELNKYFRTFILGQNALNGDADALETLNKEMQKETEILNENSVQIITNTGLSLDFLDVINQMNNAYAQEFTNLQKTRLGLLTNETQTKKLSDTIRTKLNPIFGEQNSLIMSNINLELERSKIMDLITSANNNVATATKNRNQASKDLERLQIDENVRDAEAAIRKNELSTQIALLTQAKQNGKDVTAELALAEAELAEAEFELANDSDALRLARERLDLAEQNLQKSLENQNLAQEKRKDLLYEIIDVTEDSEKATDKYTSALERNLEAYRRFRAFETAPDLGFPRPDPNADPDIPPIPEPTPVPTPLVSDNSNVDKGLKSAATDVTVLDNSDNRFSPNQSTHYYDAVNNRTKIQPLKRIRIKATYDAVEYTIFHGFVESFPVNYPAQGSDSETKLKCVDAFKLLNNATLDGLGWQLGISKLGTTTRLTLTQAQELSSVRAKNILDSFGYSNQAISTGQLEVQVQPETDTLLAALRAVELAENGTFFIGANGDATFRDRNYRLTNTTTPEASFGQGVGQLNYVDIVTSYDDDKIINTVQRTRTGGTTQVAISSDSVERFGSNVLTQSGTLNTDDSDVYLLQSRLL
jgi:hypothetical protein